MSSLLVNTYKQFFHPWLSLVRGSADLLFVTWRNVSCLFSNFCWYSCDFLVVFNNRKYTEQLIHCAPHNTIFGSVIILLSYLVSILFPGQKSLPHKNALWPSVFPLLNFSVSSLCLWQLERCFERKDSQMLFFLQNEVNTADC